jgi:hypothetical protein
VQAIGTPYGELGTPAMQKFLTSVEHPIVMYLGTKAEFAHTLQIVAHVAQERIRACIDARLLENYDGSGREKHGCAH